MLCRALVCAEITLLKIYDALKLSGILLLMLNPFEEMFIYNFYFAALNGESCSAIQQQAFQPATSGQSDVTTSQNSNTTDIGEQQLEEPEDPSYANSAIHIANFEGYLVKRKRKINGLYKEYEVSSGDAGNAVMVVSTLFSICILCSSSVNVYTNIHLTHQRRYYSLLTKQRLMRILAPKRSFSGDPI